VPVMFVVPDGPEFLKTLPNCPVPASFVPSKAQTMAWRSKRPIPAKPRDVGDEGQPTARIVLLAVPAAGVDNGKKAMARCCQSILGMKYIHIPRCLAYQAAFRRSTLWKNHAFALGKTCFRGLGKIVDDQRPIGFFVSGTSPGVEDG